MSGVDNLESSLKERCTARVQPKVMYRVISTISALWVLLFHSPKTWGIIISHTNIWLYMTSVGWLFGWYVDQ